MVTRDPQSDGTQHRCIKQDDGLINTDGHICFIGFTATKVGNNGESFWGTRRARHEGSRSCVYEMAVRKPFEFADESRVSEVHKRSAVPAKRAHRRLEKKTNTAADFSMNSEQLLSGTHFHTTEAITYHESKTSVDGPAPFVELMIVGNR